MKYTIAIIVLIMGAMQIHAMGHDEEAAMMLPKSVSYIYYPTQRGMPLGHASFAFGDYIDDSLNADARLLSRAIEKTTEKDGYPFFLFRFDVKPAEAQIMKQTLGTSEYILEDSCSAQALVPLRKAGVCDVPFPIIRVFPLLAATYLATGKAVGNNRVRAIEYYGGKSKIKDAIRMAPGIAVESFITVVPSLVLGLASYTMYQAYLHQRDRF
jgi:hypothetical protein